MPICLSFGGANTYHVESEPTEILCGTVDGVFVIERAKSGRWRTSRRGLERCHIHALIFEPSSGLIFAGLHKGSVYVSSDLGKTWKNSDTGLTQANIFSANFNQVGSKVRIYVGTEPAHLFHSDDLGETWNEMKSLRSVPSVSQWTYPTPPHIAHVRNINFDPSNPNIIYACIEQGGLLRSIDAGDSWEDIHGFDSNIPFPLDDGAFANDVHRISIGGSDPKCLYICGGAGICCSKDGGATWEHLTPHLMRIRYPDSILVHPQYGKLLFTAGARLNPKHWRESHDADAAIARSRDGGKNWQLLQEGLPEHLHANFEAMAMAVYDSSFSLFAGTTEGDIFFSEDEGEHWSTIATGLPAISKGGHYLALRRPEPETKTAAKVS